MDEDEEPEEEFDPPTRQDLIDDYGDYLFRAQRDDALLA